MAYQYPLNGGRINATIGGNTAGAGSLVSTGTLTLVGGNNITLSQAGNAVTISGGAGGGGGAGLSAGTQSVNTGTVNFANSNGITFGMSGSNQITASHNGITSQTNQTLGLYASGANTIGQSSSSTMDARSFNFSGQGGLSAGLSGSTLQLSVPAVSSLSATGIVSLSANGNTLSIGASQSVQTQGVQTVNIGGNTAGATASISSGALSLYGGNNVTLSQNANSLTISAGAGGGGGVAMYDGVASISSGTAVFSDSNGVSFGINGQTITGSIANQTLGLYVSGANTIGQSSSSTMDARSFNFSGQGAISAGYSGSTMQLSAPATSMLSATGAVSISTNGGTISIGAAPFDAGVSNLGNTLGNTGSNTGGLYLVGGNNITLSQTTNATGAFVTISAGTGGGGGGATLSKWVYPEFGFTSLSGAAQGSLSIQHMYVPFNVTGTAAKIGGLLTAGTSTSASTGGVTASLWMGIYSLNGSTLSLASSGSASTNFTISNSASSTANTSIAGMRHFTVPMNVNMTPGEYWVGAVMSTTTNYTPATMGFTMYGNDRIISNAGGAFAPILVGINTNAAIQNDVYPYQGIYTAVTSAGPASIVRSAINNTLAAYVQRAAFYNAIYNATY